MAIKRRNFLKGLAGTGAGIASLPLISATASARENKQLQDEHVGMLYDNTRCIGCKSCEAACKRANNLPAELDDQGIYDAPRDLSVKTMNIIKLYQGENEQAYVKRQCMHCVDPSCVSGCPVSALNKQSNGIVTWDQDACCGCRYCEMNCPYNVPKYEYQAFYGKIVKCEMCISTNLPDRGQPACTEACPNKAVIYGKVKSLLKLAKERIADSPNSYLPHVYGENEGGGTSVLYLSKVPFQKLGLPELPNRSQASLSESVQHSLYQGLIAPIVIYAGLAAIAFKNRSGDKEE
jgi:Fe-S-cluster-containing dehydrogenase component